MQPGGAALGLPPARLAAAIVKSRKPGRKLAEAADAERARRDRLLRALASARAQAHEAAVIHEAEQIVVAAAAAELEADGSQ